MTKVSRDKETKLTAEKLRKVIFYNPKTGKFKRLKGFKITGCIQSDGYRRIRVSYSKYFSGRLAWLYMTGRWPTNQIDHINGKKSDDRWCNLREATLSQNNRNRNGKSVYLRHGKRWETSINVNKKYFYLGKFDSRKMAIAAYNRAAKKHFKEFARERK